MKPKSNRDELCPRASVLLPQWLAQVVVAFALLPCSVVLSSADSNQVSSPNDDSAVAAAIRVLSGRDHAHSRFKACEPVFRQAGYDPRFFVATWDNGRFDIFEAAQSLLASSSGTLQGGTITARSPAKGGTDRSTAAPAASSIECQNLVRNDTPARRGIDGVAENDLERMRQAYRASQPDPHVARDKSLYNDCLRAAANSQRVSFDAAQPYCDCVLTTMRTVPSDELDGWFNRQHAGIGGPMQNETWYGNLLPKLMACSGR